jgi:hypothetical protein
MSINPEGAMRRLAISFLIAVALGGQPGRAEAQYLPERAFAVASTNTAAPPEEWETTKRPRAWPYVLTGAILGASALGVGLALYNKDTNEAAIMSPFSLLPAFAGCATVGGGRGYVVYRIRL